MSIKRKLLKIFTLWYLEEGKNVQQLKGFFQQNSLSPFTHLMGVSKLDDLKCWLNFLVHEVKFSGYLAINSDIKGKYKNDFLRCLYDSGFSEIEFTSVDNYFKIPLKIEYWLIRHNLYFFPGKTWLIIARR